MILLDGKAAAAEVRAEVAARVRLHLTAGRRAPGLVVALVGEDPASQVYVRNKEKACAEVGVRSETVRLGADATMDQLARLLGELNDRDDVDGILVQMPLPRGLDPLAVQRLIRPDKDVDGFHPENVGRMVLGLPGLRPCTPAGVMRLLARHGLDPSGRKAVVVGRSNIVGKPMSLLLLEAHATVSICHSRTPDLAAECRQADFLIAAIGRPRMITADMVKEGAVVVDVGINRTAQGLCGDCDFEAIAPKASAMTPVPGGVGPMTIALLLANTLQSFEARQG